MAKLRTAVVGVGHLGRHHARWFKNISHSELVGVYDTDREKCERVAAEYGVAAFGDIETLFGKVDAVSVVVPTTEHYRVARILLENKINCLVEKPLAVTNDQARELIDIARRQGAIMTVGHIERFNPAVLALKKYDIKPRFIEAHRLAAFDPRGTDVAVILDLMIHDIELALHFIGSEVTHIEASAVAVISDTADIANARLIFKNGAVANLTASRISLRAMRKLRLFQKSGYFSLDLAERRADIYRLAEGDIPPEEGTRIPLGKSGRDIVYSKAAGRDEDMLCAELTSFLKAVQSQSEPEVSPLAAAQALNIALEIEEIGRRGTAII